MLLGLLCEQGIMELDDLVEQHFPEIKQLVGYSDYEPITFRQLASHTFHGSCRWIAYYQFGGSDRAV